MFIQDNPTTQNSKEREPANDRSDSDVGLMQLALVDSQQHPDFNQEVGSYL